MIGPVGTMCPQLALVVERKNIKVRQPLGPSASCGASSRCEAGSCHSQVLSSAASQV